MLLLPTSAVRGGHPMSPKSASLCSQRRAADARCPGRLDRQCGQRGPGCSRLAFRAMQASAPTPCRVRRSGWRSCRVCLLPNDLRPANRTWDGGVPRTARTCSLRRSTSARVTDELSTAQASSLEICDQTPPTLRSGGSSVFCQRVSSASSWSYVVVTARAVKTARSPSFASLHEPARRAGTSRCASGLAPRGLRSKSASSCCTPKRQKAASGQQREFPGAFRLQADFL